MVVVLRFGLADNSFALFRKRCEIGEYVDSRTRDAPAGVVVVRFGKMPGSRRIETRMHDGENETAGRLEHPLHRSKYRSDLGHIHQGHSANRFIEPIYAQRFHVPRFHRIYDVILHRDAGLRSSVCPLDKTRALVERDHVRAEFGHSPTEPSGPAGDVEHYVAFRDFQQAFGSRFDQHGLKIIAVADPVVPPACIRFPDPAILVGVFREMCRSS